jgi:hypothetical protein
MLETLSTMEPAQMSAVAATADVALKLLIVAGGIVAFVVGLWQYRRAQKWKRSEWVAQEMRQFFGDADVRRALLMIDWGKREITFSTDSAPFGTVTYAVSDAMIVKALQHHTLRKEKFSDEETLIRDTFDRFLDGLERLASFRACRLVSANDLRPYLAYWFNKIRDAEEGNSQRQRLVQLRRYIESYGFRGVQQLFLDYRDDPLLPPVANDWWRAKTLEDRVAAGTATFLRRWLPVRPATRS